MQQINNNPNIRQAFIKYLTLQDEHDQNFYLRDPKIWKFLNHDVDSITCQKCSLILHDPIQLECSHSICKECFKKLPIHLNLKKCPCCSQRSSVNVIQNTNQQKVALKYFQYPCLICPQWKGNLNFLKQHLKLHKLDYDYCSKCNDDYLLMYEREHMNYDCPKRLVQCPYCKLDYYYGNWEDHECKEAKVCEFCSIQYIDSHECSAQRNLNFLCPMRDLGCDFEVSALSQLETHLGCSCQHQFLRCEKCNQLFMKKDMQAHLCRGYGVQEILDLMRQESSKENKVELLVVLEKEGEVNGLIDIIQKYFGDMKNFSVRVKEKSKKFLVCEADNLFVAANLKNALRWYKGGNVEVHFDED